MTGPNNCPDGRHTMRLGKCRMEGERTGVDGSDGPLRLVAEYVCIFCDEVFREVVVADPDNDSEGEEP